MRRLLLCIALLATADLAVADGAYMPSIAMGDVVIPLTSLKQARTGRTLIQKYDFSCGSAALATLLTHHYGFAVSEQTVFQQMFEHGDQAKIRTEGFSLLDMKRFLEAQGFQADGFKQPLDKLNEARVPAIVLINSDGYHHFVVVKGVQDDRVLLGDPAMGTRAMPRKVFESKWQNGLLFVIHNRMESARFNVAADWRAAPRAPVGTSMARNGLTDLSLPKLGAGDF